jgi:hypothetical protein
MKSEIKQTSQWDAMRYIQAGIVCAHGDAAAGRVRSTTAGGRRRQVVSILRRYHQRLWSGASSEASISSSSALAEVACACSLAQGLGLSTQHSALSTPHWA